MCYKWAMRAAIYARVSNDPKAMMRSVEQQEAECRAVAEREGWDVVEVFVDNDRSASRHAKQKRPAYGELRSLIEQGGCDVLVTWECSRAQRDLDAYLKLREMCAKAGVLWSYSGRTFDMGRTDDRFSTALDALLSERESDVTRDRILRHMRANAANGRPHGRRLYGYQRVYDPANGALVTQEPHPVEADVVRRVFRDYLAGNGCRTIARTLNAEGLRTAAGAEWSDTTVHGMLRNPGYVARRVHRGEVVGPGVWTSLVDDDTFDRVQARLDSQRTYAPRGEARARMLTGIARCGKCGGKMGALHDRNYRKVYACQSGYCVTRDTTKVDDYVSAQIIERLGRRETPTRMSSVPNGEVDEAEARLAVLSAQLDDAVEQFAAGRLTGATLAKVEARLMPAIAEAKSQMRRLVPFSVDIDPPTTDVAGWWDSRSDEVRRAIAKALLAAVVVLPATKPGARVFEPDKVLVEWR